MAVLGFHIWDLAPPLHFPSTTFPLPFSVLSLSSPSCGKGREGEFVESIFRSSCSNIERDHCRKFLILSDFFQNFVLISKKYWYFLSYHVNIYVIIIIRVKVADGTLPYWKLWFSSTNFKIFQSQKLLAAFCWKLQIYSKEVLVNEINRKINSDKFSCSYDDLYLGVSVSFWDSGYLAKWCSNKVNVQSS